MPATLRSTGKAAAVQKAADGKDTHRDVTGDGANWVDGGLGHGTIVVPLLLFFCPLLAQATAYITSAGCKGAQPPSLTGMFNHCSASGWVACALEAKGKLLVAAAQDPSEAIYFLAAFMGLALLLDVFLPGKTCTGPETKTGHVPKYTDNALLHCILFSAAFFFLSQEGVQLLSSDGTALFQSPYNLGVMCE